ncbi:DUF6776 family protein [Thiorhodovibrio frisius]|uniref:Uncharacterized protein n=1 Tax=Thiorhodovibrio frisius TaxID=631362 RepID=H8Z5J0_9GAMM|nr:DUF6776 family protein [Thiorhodovibrio frisius]EIC20560.1 hypothetical protein Thi970DRAFT_04204 [Thiorhodovibrio frisius]WPL21308.1 hypothetical protein Thiofri_01421 [Thiorhodovibrio frisius]
MGSSGARFGASGGAFRLFVTLGWLAVIGTAFVLGYQLAYHDADNTLIEMQQLKADRHQLREALMAAEERVAGLEQAQSIDREAKRLAQEQLEKLQHERHEYAKQVSALERLIREGGGGVVRVQDFELWETEQPQEFGYRFTVAQLIPEFGQASGQVKLRLKGNTNEGDAVVRTAEQLKGSEPAVHRMNFEFFQNFNGVLKVPDDFQPQTLTVEIEPNVKNLISSSRTYAWTPDAWRPEPTQALRLTQPASAAQLDEQTAED